MTTPKPLLDDDQPLTPLERQVLRTGRELQLAPEAKHAIWLAVAANLPLPPGGGAGPHGSGHAPPAPSASDVGSATGDASGSGSAALAAGATKVTASVASKGSAAASLGALAAKTTYFGAASALKVGLTTFAITSSLGAGALAISSWHPPASTPTGVELTARPIRQPAPHSDAPAAAARSPVVAHDEAREPAPTSDALPVASASNGVRALPAGGSTLGTPLTARNEAAHAEPVVDAPREKEAAPPIDPAPADVLTPAASAENERMSRLREESSLVRRAREQVQRGDANGALATLRAANAEFGAGVLGQEREALTIEALSLAGRNAEAEGRARAFLRAYPNSAHASDVRGFANELARTDSPERERTRGRQDSASLLLSSWAIAPPSCLVLSPDRRRRPRT